MQGQAFWRKFLFELPFVLLHGAFYGIIISASIVTLVMWYKIEQEKKRLEQEE